MEEQRPSLKEATRIKLMEAFAQLDGGISILERRVDYLEKIIENVDQRTSALQSQIHMKTIKGSFEELEKKQGF